MEEGTHQRIRQVSSNNEFLKTERKTEIMINDDLMAGIFQSNDTHIKVEFSTKDEDKKGEVKFPL